MRTWVSADSAATAPSSGIRAGTAMATTKQSQSETWAIQSATVERLQKEGILEKPRP